MNDKPSRSSGPVIVYTLAGAILAIAPWLMLRYQEVVRYSDQPGRLWPWFTLPTLFFVGLYILLFILANRDNISQSISSYAINERYQRAHKVIGCLLPLVSLILSIQSFLSYRQSIWIDPINPMQGDMLPLIQEALRSFWIEGSYPYRFHDVGGWEISLTFPPGLWFPYSVPYLFHTDIRLWGVAAFAGLVLFSISGFLYSWFSSRCVVQSIGSIPLLFLPVVLYEVLFYHDFFPGLHLVGFWFTLAGWGICFLQGRYLLSGIFFGWALISRPYMIVLVPFLALYIFLKFRHDRNGMFRMVLGSVFFPVLLGIPFLLYRPEAFTYAYTKGYEEALLHWVNAEEMRIYGMGFTGIFGKLGVYEHRTIIAIILQGILFLCSFKLMRRAEDFLRVCSLSLFLFISCVVIPYHYAFPAALILFIISFSVWSKGSRSDCSPESGPLGEKMSRWGLLSVPPLTAVVLAGLIMTQVFSPPGKIPSGLYAGNDRLFRNVRSIWGTQEWGFRSLQDGEFIHLQGANSFLGLPARNISHKTLEIGFQSTGSSPDRRLYLNGQYLGIWSDQVEGPGSQGFEIPPQTLIYGQNVLRIECFSSSCEDPLAVKQLTLVDPVEWKFR